MIWYRGLAAVVLALIVSACAGGSSQTVTGLVRTHGLIVRVGGPPPGSPVPIAAELRVAGAGGTATVRTDRHGRFAFLLQPGTYRVTITGHDPEFGGRPIRPTPDVIHVRPSGPRVRLVVSIP
jgi:hypothetical protein